MFHMTNGELILILNKSVHVCVYTKMIFTEASQFSVSVRQNSYPLLMLRETSCTLCCPDEARKYMFSSGILQSVSNAIKMGVVNRFHSPGGDFYLTPHMGW